MDKNYSLPNFVSILTLNRLDLTKKAVDSVLENSSLDVRLVFFDNGSTDGTIEYLDNLERTYSEKIDCLMNRDNLGVAAARNKVFDHVISNYRDDFGWILNLDNDCLVHEGYDVAITRCVEEVSADAVCPRLVHPNGNVLYDASKGFLINFKENKIKIDYEKNNKGFDFDSANVSKRLETDVLLGTSAKTPDFFKKVGFYDEGHKIGWEDFSIALKSIGLTKEDFSRWRSEADSQKWIPLKNLVNGKSPLAKIVYEPDCVITHDHPLTEEYQDYERVRRREETIKESTDHFENVWGLRPVSRRDS